MPTLKDEIAAFDRMKAELEATRRFRWVLFHGGAFIADFPDFETAAEFAVARYDDAPCLIRQVGVNAVQLPGGMVFRPAHALDTRGL